MDEFEKWWNSDEAQMECDDAGVCSQSHRNAFEAGIAVGEARGRVLGMGEGCGDRR